jgi:hypothetical protein
VNYIFKVLVISIHAGTGAILEGYFPPVYEQCSVGFVIFACIQLLTAPYERILKKFAFY